MELTDEITLKIPRKLKEAVDKKGINVEKVLETILTTIIDDDNATTNFQEIPFPGIKKLQTIKTSTIPSGSFMRIPQLPLESYEQIVDETSWEYLDGILFHRSPESNQHNALLNLLTQRIKSLLDPHQYLIRISRVALSIGEEKPEPDLMVFERDTFRRKKRKDNTESEIIDAAPLIVIEIVSRSSKDIDQLKIDKYLTKGVREYWRIFLDEKPLQVTISILKQGKYEEIYYSAGEIRSQTIPILAFRMDELEDPDKFH